MNRRPDFASELVVLQSEVAADVGGILDTLKARKATQATAADTPHKQENYTREKVQPRPARTRTSPRLRSTPNREAQQAVILENVTTRLSRETNELLTQASLHQRLKKRAPSTRQDIIEEAVQQWLSANGYLDRGEG
jgi:hypothetical protein